MEVWSLFTGAFGLDLGLEEAGIATSLAVEIEATCCETIRLNRQNLRILHKDIRDVDEQVLREAAGFYGDVDLVIGGPPCQSFSPGGKRAALSDPRGNLVYEFLRLVNEIRPRYFVLENVANILTAALRHRQIKDRPGKHWNLKRYSTQQLMLPIPEGSDALAWDEQSGSAIRQVLCDVESLGYAVNFAVVNAADYGAPQHRLRFILIGARDGVLPRFPPATHGSGQLPYRTVRSVIEDLADSGIGSGYTMEVKRLFEMVPPGGNWRSLPKHLHASALGGAYEAGGGKQDSLGAWIGTLHPLPLPAGQTARVVLCATLPRRDRSQCGSVHGYKDFRIRGPSQVQ